MSDYLSGEAADSFETDEDLPEPALVDYGPVEAWSLRANLPAGYIPRGRVGYYKNHRLVACIAEKDLHSSSDRDRPRLRCLDCGREGDDPADLSRFEAPCRSPRTVE